MTVTKNLAWKNRRKKIWATTFEDINKEVETREEKGLGLGFGFSLAEPLGEKADRPQVPVRGAEGEGQGLPHGARGRWQPGVIKPELFAPSGNFKQPWLLGAQTGKKQVVNGKQVSGREKSLV